MNAHDIDDQIQQWSCPAGRCQWSAGTDQWSAGPDVVVVDSAQLSAAASARAGLTGYVLISDSKHTHTHTHTHTDIYMMRHVHGNIKL